jgi:hypothetical protein
VISPTQRPLPDNIQHSQETDIHAPCGIRTRDPSNEVAADPRCHRDRPNNFVGLSNSNLLILSKMPRPAKMSTEYKLQYTSGCGVRFSFEISFIVMNIKINASKSKSNNEPSVERAASQFQEACVCNK